jgi:hypothetical protein
MREREAQRRRKRPQLYEKERWAPNLCGSLKQAVQEVSQALEKVRFIRERNVRMQMLAKGAGWSLSKSRVILVSQSERHILVPADQTTSRPGIVQAIAARSTGEKFCGPMGMVIASSPVHVGGGQPHDGDAAQALTSVAVPSGIILEESCTQSKIGSREYGRRRKWGLE